MGSSTNNRIDTTSLLTCVLCRALEIVGDDLGTLRFSEGETAPAAYQLPDPQFGYNFPPSGVQVEGVFLAVQVLNLVPSKELGSDQLWIEVGICVGAYDDSSLLPAIANDLKLKMPELYTVKYYQGSELEAEPDKAILIGRYRP